MGERPCPTCGASLPDPGLYPSWCEGCDWGVTTPKVEGLLSGRLGTLAGRLSARSDADLFGRLTNVDALAPRRSGLRVLSLALAVLTLLVSVLLVVLGSLAIVYSFPDPIAAVIGIAIAGVGLLFRPRFGKSPKEGIVGRNQVPELFSLIDEVAATLAVAPPDVLVLTPRMNASWARVGLRPRKRVMWLGLPLLTALGPQSRVALLAHELAHERNGDLGRNTIVGPALTGLAALVAALSPDDPDTPSAPHGYIISSVSGTFTHLLMWTLGLPVRATLAIEQRLAMRDSQRAEYLADALAADVAGSAAMLALHEQVLQAPTLRSVIRANALADKRGAGLFTELRGALDALPERERERRRRAARAETARLDRSHPPTARRIALLERRVQAPGTVHLSAARAQQIDAELAQFEPTLAKEIVDAYPRLLV